MSSSRKARNGPPVDELVGRIEVAVAALLAKGDVSVVSEQATQQLLLTAVKLYVAKRGDDAALLPFSGSDITATDVVITASEMLKAVRVEVFELGLWNTWSRA
jgi:hypothetical protein